MWQYHSYVHRLDSILERLRAKHLGQEMRFVDMVPGGEKLPPDTLSKYVAQQLTAQFCRIDELTDKELHECYWWLRSATLHILQYVAPEDHTLRSLMRLSGLSEGALQIIAEKKLPVKYADAIPHVPEMVKDNLEEAIWLRTDVKAEQLNELEKCGPVVACGQELNP